MKYSGNCFSGYEILTKYMFSNFFFFSVYKRKQVIIKQLVLLDNRIASVERTDFL